MIDDGSTDKTGEICDAFAEKDSRYHVFHCSNGGVSFSRNFGVDHASGDYVMFIDGDDVLIDKQTLEACVAEMVSNPMLDFVQFPYALVKENIVKQRYVQNEEHEWHGYDCLFHKIFIEHVIYGYLWGKLFRKDVFGEHPFRVGFSMCEDALFYLDALYSFNSFKTIDRGLYGYTQRLDSGTKKLNRRTLSQIAVVKNKVLERAQEIDVDSAYIMKVWVLAFFALAQCYPYAKIVIGEMSLTHCLTVLTKLPAYSSSFSYKEKVGFLFAKILGVKVLLKMHTLWKRLTNPDYFANE